MPPTTQTDEAALQLNAAGSLRHLLTLDGLDRRLLVDLLDAAEGYLKPEGELPARSNALAGRTIANLFFEPSTRTRASFDLAGKRLGADVLNLDVNTSSRKKGESILDMIYTLEAMSVDIMVVRDASAGVPAYIRRVRPLAPDAGTPSPADDSSAQGHVRQPRRRDRRRYRTFARRTLGSTRA